MASTTTKAIVAVGAIAAVAFGVVVYNSHNNPLSTYKPVEEDTSATTQMTPAEGQPSSEAQPSSTAPSTDPAPSEGAH